MDVVLRNIVSEPIGEISEQVMGLIMCEGSITRVKLIREMRHRISVRELEVVLEALVGAEFVEKDTGGGGIVYRYIGGKEKKE